MPKLLDILGINGKDIIDAVKGTVDELVYKM